MKSANNKGWLYLWSDDYGAPSGPGMGPNFWPSDAGQSASSFYVWPLDRHWWPDDPAWGGSNVVETVGYGTWFEVYMHYRYATVADNDGVAQVWKRRADEPWDKLLEITDGNWYVAGQPGFDRGYLWGWSNSGFTEEIEIFIDDVAFSEQDFVTPGV